MTLSTSSSRRSKTIALLLAISLPILLLLVLIGLFTVVPKWSLVHSAQRMDDKLALTDDLRLLVLGNSIAKTDIDLDMLAKKLKVPKKSAFTLEVAGSVSPTWYMLLLNRVYAQGLKPELIVIPVRFPWLTISELELTNSKAMQNLYFHSLQSGSTQTDNTQTDNTVNPILKLDPKQRHIAYKKVFGELTAKESLKRKGVTTDSRWIALHEWAVYIRDVGLNTIQRVVVKVVFSQSDFTLNHREAYSEVLPFGAIDFYRQSRAIPVADPRFTYVEKTIINEQPLSDTVIPDLVALATDNGATVIFVETPKAPNDRRPIFAEISRQRIIDNILSTGAKYINMSEMAVHDSDFLDIEHLNAQGKQKFTIALADALVDLEPSAWPKRATPH